MVQQQLSSLPSLPAMLEFLTLPHTIISQQPVTLLSMQQPVLRTIMHQPITLLAQQSVTSQQPVALPSMQQPTSFPTMQQPITSLAQQSGVASLQPLPISVATFSSGSPDLALLFNQFICYATSKQAAPSYQMEPAALSPASIENNTKVTPMHLQLPSEPSSCSQQLYQPTLPV